MGFADSRFSLGVEFQRLSANGFLGRRDFRRNTTGGVGIGESGVYVVDGEHCLSYCVIASTPLDSECMLIYLVYVCTRVL